MTDDERAALVARIVAYRWEHKIRQSERPTSPEAQQAVQRFHAHLSLACFCAAREQMRGERKWKA